MVTSRSFTNSSTGMKTLKARECALLISVPSMPCGVKTCAIRMCVCAKSLQSCPTLCDPTNCSLPGSSVQGIFQARILEWVASSYSRKSFRPRDQTHLSCISRGSLYILGFARGLDGKESACNAGDLGLIPGLGRSPGEGNGNPLQYSCLENPLDRGAW